MNIAVIGGGAAGYTAAIAAARNGVRVTICEKCDRTARKILATGNGRCNMSNRNASEKNYHGSDPRFIRGVMRRFWVEETLDFFENLGIVPKEEENGKIFPYSLQAAAVSDVLRYEADRLGIKTICNFEVNDIKRGKNCFRLISTSGETVEAEKVILAAGGKASPNLGSDGSGYKLAEKFGHKTTKLYPSLVQVKTENTYTKALQGLKVNGTAAFFENDKLVKKVGGEILFTEYGLSGPPIFDLSRLASTRKNGEIRLDLMPEYSYEQVVRMLEERKYHKKTLETYFTGMLAKKLGQVLLKSCDTVPLSRDAKTLSKREIETAARKIKSWSFSVTGVMPWKNAQVTAGGIETSGVDPSTLESKKVRGLYFAGEILDIDGDCGGYNLQWAWASGYVAGMSASKQKGCGNLD